jgi:hypothetical protein
MTITADIDDDTHIVPSRTVLNRYNIVDRTLRRWEENPALGFPRHISINGRRYWRVADLRAWELARAKAVRS